MFSFSSGIDSLTRFKRETAEFLRTLHDTGEPLVLTVNGKAEVVVQDAAAYQRLVEAATRAEHEETLAAIRRGLADVKADRTQPAEAVIAEIAKRFNLRITDA